MNLYISHKNYNWVDLKKQFTLWPLNLRNLEDSLRVITNKNYYTSLEDLELKADQFTELLEKIDHIILIDLDICFFEKVDNDSLFAYLNFFNFLKKYYFKKTVNFEWIDQLSTQFDTIESKRKSDKQTLWVSGCSLTAGSGVNENERYANLLSEKVNLELSLLARAGSSITWQADQILRSDIRADDLVVWGLTNYARVDYADGLVWKSVPASNLEFKDYKWKYWTYDYFDSCTRAIECIKSIQHVHNFCEKIGAKLVIVNLLDNVWSNLIFSKLTNYLDLTVLQDINAKFKYIDLGQDNDHPGPKQHQYYAEKIYQFIKENYHGKTI